MKRLVFVAAIAALTTPACAWAAECTGEKNAVDEVRPTLTLLAENDMFNGTNDRNYTSGLQASVVSRWRVDPCIEAMLNWLTPSDDPQGWTNSVGLTNMIFTPEDLTLPGFNPNDRPYAGVTALTFSAFAYSRTLEDGETDQRDFDEFAVSLGAIGPASGSDELQSWWHQSVLHIGVPAGWEENQVDSEVLVQLDYQHTENVDSTRQHGPDLTWSYGFGVGTFMDYARVGTRLRLGVNMAGDIGPPRIGPGSHGAGYWNPDPSGSYLGGYVFAGFDQRYIAYDYTLDSWPSAIERREWVADAQVGWVLHVGGARVSAVYVWRQKQFRGQPEDDSFGAYSVTFSDCWACYWPRHNRQWRPLFRLNPETPGR